MKNSILSTNALRKATVGLMLSGLSITAQAQVGLEYPGGPSGKVTHAQVQNLKDWYQNSLNDIQRLLGVVDQSISGSDLKFRMVQKMEQIAAQQKNLRSDLLLRHALYMGLTLNRIIEKESIRKGVENTPQGTVDQQVRVLRKALNLAKNYYQSDIEWIQNHDQSVEKGVVQPLFVEFGNTMHQYVVKMSEGVLDISSSYGMLRWSLGVYLNYLTQDPRAYAFASTIKYLSDELSLYPDVANNSYSPSDAQCLRSIRELKRLSQVVQSEVYQVLKNR